MIAMEVSQKMVESAFWEAFTEVEVIDENVGVGDVSWHQVGPALRNMTSHC